MVLIRPIAALARDAHAVADRASDLGRRVGEERSEDERGSAASRPGDQHPIEHGSLRRILRQAHGCVVSMYRFTAPMNSRWPRAPGGRELLHARSTPGERRPPSSGPHARPREPQLGIVGRLGLASSVVARETSCRDRWPDPRSPADERFSEKSASRPNVISRMRRVAEGVVAYLWSGQRLHHVAMDFDILPRDVPVAVDVEVSEDVEADRLEHARPVDGVGLQDVLRSGARRAASSA